MPDYCIFCGDWHLCRNISVISARANQESNPASKAKCCNECSGFLSGKLFRTLELTAKYLIEAYIQNRKKDLNFPDWEESELKGLGYNLMTSTESKIARKKVYMLKIENLELVSNGFECKPFHDYLNKESKTVLASSKKCLNCGMVFFNVKKNDYCSQYCNGQHKAKLVAEHFFAISQNEADWRLEERKCLVCEVPLKTSNGNVFFCSNPCTQAFNRAVRSIKKKTV